MLYVGVDEAGYGPLLGPLVVGIAALRVSEAPCASPRPSRYPSPPAPPETLPARLRGLVVRQPRSVRATRERPLPVPVDDSKRIHRRFGLEGLARGVGAFASAMGTPPPADLADLLERFSDRQPEEFHGLPWYANLEAAPVPLYPWTGPLQDRFVRRGVEALDLRVLPLSAAELNVEFEARGNKARVLSLASGAVLLALLDRFPGEDAEVVFDRQGSRLDYAELLADLFPFAPIERRPAPRGEALYVLRLPDRRLEIRFATGADRQSLAVSWASMAAKLTRELFMARFNAWFLERVSDVRPTAGYYEDGRRFLADVAHVIEGESILSADLVRTR